MKLDKLLNEKLHKHQFEVAKEKIGRVNFTGIAGGVKENVRVKAVQNTLWMQKKSGDKIRILKP